ncbi:hypothetical protein N0V88_005680 [Collariella sp. IMI 366227]|nr:hypothetical protein N0V88_005680 [Collariella sp. IMI 366227]
MDDHARAAYESQSLQLRADLKKWEGDWAATHGGKKPGRDDIKQNPDLAQKYKQYNKLRDIIAGKIPPPSATTHAHQQRKRAHSDAVLQPQTPSKRARPAQTPRKTQHFLQFGDVPAGAQTPPAGAATPSMNRAFLSPAVPAPTSISPTPQKDGRVLGLFDLLAGTPSRRTLSLTGAAANLSRVDEQDENRDEEEEWKKVGPLRLPRKLGLGRTLSSVVAGLRRLEEEAFGDEEEAMREMEMEMEMGGMGAGPLNRGGTAGTSVVEVRDSQLGAPKPNEAQEERAVNLLSAFDDEAQYDSLDETGVRDQTLRQFKKRGQKRTTRLVNMRPTRAKRPVNPQPEEDEDDDLVPETQFNQSLPPTNEDGLLPSDIDSASLASFDPSSDNEDDEGATNTKAKKTKQKQQKKSSTAAAENAKDAKDAKDGGTDGKSESVVKRAVRKVKATAHANFKRLKLRNNGAKGGPGYNSRFRRRR